ncbi:MAG TPA: SMI1/KNR4 family protein [Phycisphaerae bacterium]|nr:SMI1/KNR4 family protein [Phycisphaerae bacterium]
MAARNKPDPPTPATVTVMLGAISEQFPNFGASLRAGRGDPIEQVSGPATLDDIDAIEKRLAIPLPESYKRLLGCSSGFWLLGGCVKFQYPFFHDFPPLEQLTPIQRQTLDAKGGIWPPPTQAMLCFADFFWEADGDQVLFDVKSGLAEGEYPIVYYAHESCSPEARRVARRFDEWIEDCLSAFVDED